MNCNCHCHGKCHLLGGLEQKIMDILWSSSIPLKPAEVLSHLSGNYAYTTIMTVLKRLFDKKLVKRQLSGNVYFYSSIQDKPSFTGECLDDLFSRLFESYGQEVVPAFKKSAAKSGFSAQFKQLFLD